MAKYNYNVDLEVFTRENGGWTLYVNISEAQRIVSLLNLGYSISDIKRKVHLVNPKSGSSTVESFIKNYKVGNIDIPDDAPAPLVLFNELSDSRLDDLERRVVELERIIENNGSFTDKVKSWLR